MNPIQQVGKLNKQVHLYCTAYTLNSGKDGVGLYMKYCWLPDSFTAVEIYILEHEMPALIFTC